MTGSTLVEALKEAIMPKVEFQRLFRRRARVDSKHSKIEDILPFIFDRGDLHLCSGIALAMILEIHKVDTGMLRC